MKAKHVWLVHRCDPPRSLLQQRALANERSLDLANQNQLLQGKVPCAAGLKVLPSCGRNVVEGIRLQSLYRDLVTDRGGTHAPGIEA